MPYLAAMLSLDKEQESEQNKMHNPAKVLELFF